MFGQEIILHVRAVVYETSLQPETLPSPSESLAHVVHIT